MSRCPHAVPVCCLDGQGLESSEIVSPKLNSYIKKERDLEKVHSVVMGLRGQTASVGSAVSQAASV